MGRTKKLIYSIFFIILYKNFSHAQTSLSGKVVDVYQKPVTASVILKDSTQVVLAFTYSKEDGNYQLYTNKKGKFNLTFSSLGYKTKTVSLEIKSTNTIVINSVLEEGPFELDEIIIEADKSIEIKKDTIEINVNSYLKPNDATVEDLLKKIPGVSVNAEGTIKIGTREIEKLLVDGDDFFEKGYKILSKNMPPDQLKKVQILQKYSNNSLLKGIEESNKVAMNLVLKEDAKRQWFGNISLAQDVDKEHRYELKTYTMNFGKKNKYVFFTNVNAIGYDATGDINHLIRPIRNNEVGIIGDNAQINNLLNLSFTDTNFKRSRTNFNNAEMVSLNAIFNPSEKLKIKTLGFFNWDENDFFRNSKQVFSVNNINFTNTENYTIRNTKRIAFGRLDLNYSFTQTQTLDLVTKFNNGNYLDTSNLQFNGSPTIENLKHQNTLYDQSITYTNKIKKKRVILLSGRYKKEETPQYYQINQFFYQDLFPSNAQANNVAQQVNNKMTYAVVKAHLLDRKANKNLFEIAIGNEFRKDQIQTNFQLLETKKQLDVPTDFQNQFSYQVNDLYLNMKYIWQISRFKIIGKLNSHQIFNRLETAQINHQNPFFINPSVGLNWEINSKNKITTSYGVNRTNAKVLDILPNFVLTGFRNFSKGTGQFNQLDASSFSFNYQLGNWSDKFFANTFLLYTKNHDFFSTNAIINQNYNLSEKIRIQDREFLSVNSTIDYFIAPLSSNIKLIFGYSESEFKNRVNNSSLREITSSNYNYGTEFRSGFGGAFNYHIGTKWIFSKINTTISNSFTDNNSFLDLSFVINDNFDFQLKSERYYFGNLQQDNTYYFLDFESQYQLKNKKVSFSIQGRNLTNTSSFRNFSISDLGTSTTETRLLPRMILLQMKYRF